jgi:hypothetical protein
MRLKAGDAVSNAQKIRMALAYKGIKEAELARLLETTPQAFNQRMKTDKFSTDDLNKIAAALEAKFIPCSLEFPDGTII